MDEPAQERSGHERRHSKLLLTVERPKGECSVLRGVLQPHLAHSRAPPPGMHSRHEGDQFVSTRLSAHIHC